MKTFESFDPIAVTVYFLSVALIPIFFLSPLLLAPSLIGAITLFSFTIRRGRIKTHLFMLAALAAASLVNPIYSHKGETVLLLINDTPFTLEAFLYGVTAAVMIITAVYWFRSFSVIMTEDKLLYVFGKLSPKAALTLSMALRYIGLFTTRMRQIESAQRANGLYVNDSLIDSLKSSTRIFSVTVTWALENGIITAASMKARGYGTGKRSSFSIFRFGKKDAILLCVTLILLALTLLGTAIGGAKFEFYPRFTASSKESATLLALIPYSILSFIPAIIETEERLRWKFLKSKN